jgi:hypothetical protein
VNTTGTCEKTDTPLTRAAAGSFATCSDLLRVAAEQWPHKSPEDQEIERRFIARDLAAFEASQIRD